MWRIHIPCFHNVATFESCVSVTNTLEVNYKAIEMMVLRKTHTCLHRATEQ